MAAVRILDVVGNSRPASGKDRVAGPWYAQPRLPIGSASMNDPREFASAIAGSVAGLCASSWTDAQPSEFR